MYIYCIWISPTFSMKGECSDTYMYTHSTYILTCVHIYSCIYMYVYVGMFIGIYMYVNTHVSEYFSLAFFVPVKSLILKVNYGFSSHLSKLLPPSFYPPLAIPQPLYFSFFLLNTNYRSFCYIFYMLFIVFYCLSL